MGAHLIMSESWMLDRQGSRRVVGRGADGEWGWFLLGIFMSGEEKPIDGEQGGINAGFIVFVKWKDM